MKKILITTLLIILVFTITTYAETVNLELNYLEYNKDHMSFKENTIYKDEITITSNSGKYYEEEKKINLKENIKLLSSDYQVLSDEMEGLLEEDKYTFTENVVAQNINGNKKDFKLNSKKLVYNAETGDFIGKENVKINVDKRIITGNKADYNDEKEEMIVTENVNIKNENSEIKTEKITISLKGDESFTTEGKTKIKIEI